MHERPFYRTDAVILYAYTRSLLLTCAETKCIHACLLRGQPIAAFADTPPFRIPRLMPRIRTQPEGGILLDLGSEPIGSL